MYKQKKIEKFKDLLSWISYFFDVDLSAISLDEFDKRIPKCLQYLYAIEDFFALQNFKLEKNRFFNNQFRLIPYADLHTHQNSFDFVVENQNNWRVAYDTINKSIFLSEHYELPYNTKLPYSLEEFTITFALHEIVYNCNNFKVINEVKNKISLEPLWVNKLMIDYPIHFYTVNNNAIIMDAGCIILGTNNENTFQNTLKILK